MAELSDKFSDRIFPPTLVIKWEINKILHEAILKKKKECYKSFQGSGKKKVGCFLAHPARQLFAISVISLEFAEDVSSLTG